MTRDREKSHYWQNVAVSNALIIQTNKTQQKEFIKYLEDTIQKEHKNLDDLCDIYKVPKENNSTYKFLCSFVHRIEEILSKYKEIIGEVKVNKEIIKLINENPDLPIYAWVNGEVCEDNCGYWLGQFRNAEIKEYAKVETYGWYDKDYVFKDDYEEYLEYLLNENENLTEEEAIKQIESLDYKKAIFVYVNMPVDF